MTDRETLLQLCKLTLRKRALMLERIDALQERIDAEWNSRNAVYERAIAYLTDSIEEVTRDHPDWGDILASLEQQRRRCVEDLRRVKLN
jgi:hypothetical protein